MTDHPTPLVSVVTPFYNTVEYLPECIESVLRQNYQNWEYLLVNNRSTDGSDAIARSYAVSDSRIRFIDNEEFLSQVDNYNHALRQISPTSKYTKIVQADDWIYPSCLREMVDVAEATPDAAVVGSYSFYEPLRVYGPRAYVGHAGLPYTCSSLPGRDALRRHLLGSLGLFGSPTVMMFRSADIRARRQFFRDDSPVEDIEACFDVLKTGDYAFAHQVLSFNRRQDDSIWVRMSAWNADALNRLIILRRHGRDVLTTEEYDATFHQARRNYYRQLAAAFLDGRGEDYWQYHSDGLATASLTLERRYLAWHVARAVLELAACPKSIAGQLARRWRGDSVNPESR